MGPLDNYVQQCVDFVLPVFLPLAENSNQIISTPLDSDVFTPELLMLQWKPLLDHHIESSCLDVIVDLSLKRIIFDALTNEHKDDSNMHMKKCAVVLDFCFHSKKNRKKPESWSLAFFDLFSTTLDVLDWPSGTLEFWPYAESRMQWFKMGTSLVPPPFGTTNLISYKQPLYDKLRHWNDVLKTVQNNSSLNTPLDSIMNFKLMKFLSELLSVHEESNFNRSALVSRKQGSGNPWNRTISSSTKHDDSSENIFATDYNYVVDNLLTCPLEFAFRPPEQKVDLDKVLVNLLDNLFDSEEEFYKRIKNSQKKLSDIDEKINYKYPCNFGVTNTSEPNYAKNSARIKKERSEFWEELWNMKSSAANLIQPTLLDISSENPDILYTQMMDTDNDFYRKQFLLQLYFTIYMTRQIVTVPEVENFYKICYQKEKPSRSINFDNLDEFNRKKTSSLCNHILDNRIIKFYHNRDPPFSSLIQRLAKKDATFLNAKVDGFKVFQNFTIVSTPVHSPDFDYTFKRFGFIEMGNKLLSNVWKINTGLNLTKRHHESPKELYEELHVKFDKGQLDNADDGKPPADKIIKEWQYLRSLRSQYLFDFNKVDEKVGIKGLFDPSLMTAEDQKNKDVFRDILRETQQPHFCKLEEARNYIAQKQIRKRTYEDEIGRDTQKKTKMTNEHERDAVTNFHPQTLESQETNEVINVSLADEKNVVKAEKDALSRSPAIENCTEGLQQAPLKSEGDPENSRVAETCTTSVTPLTENNEDQRMKDGLHQNLDSTTNATAVEEGMTSATGSYNSEDVSVSPKIANESLETKK